jgi:hypothetical protein
MILGGKGRRERREVMWDVVGWVVVLRGMSIPCELGREDELVGRAGRPGRGV